MITAADCAGAGDHLDADVIFEDAWEDRVIIRLGSLEVPVVSRKRLIENQKSVGRPRDIADVAELEDRSEA